MNAPSPSIKVPTALSICGLKAIFRADSNHSSLSHYLLACTNTCTYISSRLRPGHKFERNFFECSLRAFFSSLEANIDDIRSNSVAELLPMGLMHTNKCDVMIYDECNRQLILRTPFAHDKILPFRHDSFSSVSLFAFIFGHAQNHPAPPSFEPFPSVNTLLLPSPPSQSRRN